MLTKEQSRARWYELRELVNQWDPIGLIELGSPPTEYECIVGPILRLLEAARAVEDVQAYLVREFTDHFGMPIQVETGLLGDWKGILNHYGARHEGSAPETLALASAATIAQARGVTVRTVRAWRRKHRTTTNLVSQKPEVSETKV